MGDLAGGYGEPLGEDSVPSGEDNVPPGEGLPPGVGRVPPGVDGDVEEGVLLGEFVILPAGSLSSPRGGEGALGVGDRPSPSMEGGGDMAARRP